MSFASPHRQESPCVSVILPTYDRAPLLDRSIRSVLAQTYRNLELIIVDDGSKDDTESTVGGIGDPRITYCRLDWNRGPAAARNAGIDRARGEFLAFQDSDDEWLPNKLERHLEVFSGLGDHVAVTYSDMLRIDRAGNATYHRSPDIAPGRLLNPDTKYYDTYGLGIIATVMRRSCFDQGIRFDEELRCFEDLELFLRMSARYRFHHIREPLVRYHEGDGVSTNLRRQLLARRGLLCRYREELIFRHPLFLALETLKVETGILTSLFRRTRKSRLPQKDGRTR
jgi:glycosyltransferase involved in cell wall biosynthesis